MPATRQDTHIKGETNGLIVNQSADAEGEGNFLQSVHSSKKIHIGSSR